MLNFLNDQIINIINLYTGGLSQQKTSLMLGCSQKTISNILARNNIETRVGKNIKYTDINEKLFAKIDCESAAYFLGFLYADGGIQNNNNTYTMALKLQKQDAIILEQFRDIMSPSPPITLVDNGKYAVFKINQKIIIDQLIALGCTPRKSLILTLKRNNINKRSIK